MASLNAITPAQLLRLIGTPEAPALVDICTPEDFAEDPHLVPGSFRHPWQDMAGLQKALQGRASIIICQKGRKLSQGAAAWLRDAGLNAQYLEGGAHGWRALDGAPRVPMTALPAPLDGATLWVTRHRPKIDRIACPWLIRRFVDSHARFLFVAPAEVAAVADRLGATAFDSPGSTWSHEGARCTFDTMLDRFGLDTPALLKMAEIIRAADTGRACDVPQAEGLLALSIGLSRQYRDDTAQLEAGMALYDALYRWARDGQDETHDSSGANA